MTIIVSALLAGAGVGMSIAAPIGPASMFCVQRTLAAGLHVGLATGLGVATVHLVYGTLTIFGGAEIAGIFHNTALLSVFSSLLLLWFSIRVLRRNLSLGEIADHRPTLASAYCGAVGFGFLNPLTPLLFAATIPTLMTGDQMPMPFLALGVFLGSCFWWLLLSSGVSLLRSRLTVRTLNMTNKAAGLALAVLAMAMMARGYSALV